MLMSVAPMSNAMLPESDGVALPAKGVMSVRKAKWMMESRSRKGLS
jgi:hypothetical protein